MAVFGGENWRTEFRIEQIFYPVVLFEELEVLDDALSYLRDRSYVAHEIDCRKLQTPEAIMNDVLRQMGILNADYTYENIKDIQFWDLLRGAEVPEDSGLILAFKYFSDFHSTYPEDAQAVLNSIAREHLHQMRRGRRFWVCAHCKDRTLKLEPVLTLQAAWNRQAWSAEELARSEKVGARLQARWEARAVLEKRFPAIGFREFDKALLEVTEARDFNALLDMDLSAEDIVRLLQHYNFGE